MPTQLLQPAESALCHRTYTRREWGSASDLTLQRLRQSLLPSDLVKVLLSVVARSVLYAHTGSYAPRVCTLIVCPFVKTSGASVRPEIYVTYSTGNECQKICGIFSDTASLRRSNNPSVVCTAAIFPLHALINECQLACVREYNPWPCSRAHATAPRGSRFSAFH